MKTFDEARDWWKAHGGTPEALLEAARAHAEAINLSVPTGEMGWWYAGMILGAIAQQEAGIASEALRLWKDAPGASGRVSFWDAARISASDAAERAGVSRAYIKAEIARGNLAATKNITGAYEIQMDDFKAWMGNPRRGSRRQQETTE